jgi:hypothetical protein
MTKRFPFSPQMICAMARDQGLGGAAAKLAVPLLNLPIQVPAYSYGELPTRLHLRRTSPVHCATRARSSAG